MYTLKRMVEKKDRHSKRSQNTQNTLEREILADVDLRMCI